MIKVRIKPSDVNVDPYMKALCGQTGFTKGIALVDVVIDGQQLPVSVATRLSDGKVLLAAEPGATNHPQWARAARIVERKLENYFARGGGGS